VNKKPDTNPATDMRMRFYQATRGVFPRSYSARIFALCFASVHVPIIAFGAFEAWNGELRLDVALVLLVATVAGTAIAIGGLWGLLAPIRIATDQLRRMQEGERIEHVPTGGEDLAGVLLEAVGRAGLSTQARIHTLKGVAATDPLTGLRNRRGFDEALPECLAAHGPSAIALFDVDRFKAINDNLGHERGDDLLRGLADRMRDNLRKNDLAVRFGGDEFAIVFAGASEAEAEQIVQRITRSLALRPLAAIDGEPVGVSVGFARIAASGREAVAQAFAEADAHMYERKRARRGEREGAARTAVPA
jgi:diguanylate cyclase (GGDEF)-like protein